MCVSREWYLAWCLVSYRNVGFVKLGVEQNAGGNTCTTRYNYMYKNTACSVAQDGRGVTGPACRCQCERNLKDHRKGSTKEALMGRWRLYNGLRRCDIADNTMNVGVCCKMPGFINTREVEKNQCICLCLHCAHEGRSGCGASRVESVCMRHPKYAC
jgi:hypothetical protein